VKAGQCKVVLWDDIKHNPLEQLKISPLAMIPHKSRAFRAILDLSFRLRLKDGSEVPSVNEATTLEAPAAAIDQMGHALNRIIHAFAEADEDAKIFMAKFDIKDGFWHLDCEEGEEWNFSYVLPQKEGEPTRLVVPTSLQMGWVESPPYFCAASETARDVAAKYADARLGTLEEHKFAQYARGSKAFEDLPEFSDDSQALRYCYEVYVDDFIPLAITASKQQLEHVARALLHGIHDVFPADDNDDNNPTSLKKLLKKEGQWDLLKEILGFEFDGNAKTMQLDEKKREFLLAILTKWIRTAQHKSGGVEFKEFETVIAKVRHAFMCIPEGRGLLTPMNRLLRKKPAFVYIHRNKKLFHTIKDCRTPLREATLRPPKCSELVMGAPDFVGVKDASVHGVGGIVIGENMACVPTVFRMEWPEWVKEEVRKTNCGKGGSLTNSDLEMAGLLLLFLVMEEVCDLQPGCHVALFSDNSPTISWVRKMAAKGSKVADQLLRALCLRMKQRNISPLTSLHIPGKKNAMTDIPSRSFGSEKKWHCKTDSELLTLFNASFPLPSQNSWTVFRPSSGIKHRIISALRQQALEMDEWRQLVGLDPWLQSVPYRELKQHVHLYMAMVREGHYGYGRQVRATTVSAALASVNKTILLAINMEPLKVEGTNNFIPIISQTLQGWAKEDPPTEKKLLVETDVVEHLVKCSMAPGADSRTKRIADWILIAFYYLLRIGEYTLKGLRNELKQTVQFRMRDVTFFKEDEVGALKQVSRRAPASVILAADASTLQLGNQKNGWKGVCVSHHSNGLEAFDPVRALGRRYVHIRSHTDDPDTLLSAYFDETGHREDLRDSDVRSSLKTAAAVLDYPKNRGIPIDRIDTHSLRIGGANALSLAGYSKQQIQKIGRWRGETFLEYIRERLSDFLAGMSKKMSKCFGFVCLEGGVYSDVTDAMVESEYTINVSAGAA
jgi:hypothetical protein